MNINKMIKKTENMKKVEEANSVTEEEIKNRIEQLTPEVKKFIEELDDNLYVSGRSFTIDVYGVKKSKYSPIQLEREVEKEFPELREYYTARTGDRMEFALKSTIKGPAPSMEERIYNAMKENKLVEFIKEYYINMRKEQLRDLLLQFMSAFDGNLNEMTKEYYETHKKDISLDKTESVTQAADIAGKVDVMCNKDKKCEEIEYNVEVPEKIKNIVDSLYEAGVLYDGEQMKNDGVDYESSGYTDADVAVTIDKEDVALYRLSYPLLVASTEGYVTITPCHLTFNLIDNVVTNEYTDEAEMSNIEAIIELAQAY